MDTIAMWIGYAAMTAGGIGLVLGALWLAADGCFRLWHSAWNMGDVIDATAEWRRAQIAKR